MRERAVTVAHKVALDQLGILNRCTGTASLCKIARMMPLVYIIRGRNMNKYENQNALKHGAFAEVVILPNEESKEFEELHDTVLREWNPEGPTEHGLVMSLTKDLWRKRRLGRFYQREIAK